MLACLVLVVVVGCGKSADAANSKTKPIEGGKAHPVNINKTDREMGKVLK